MMKLIKHLLEPKGLLFFAILITALITTGSLINSSSIPKVNIDLSDKIIHSLAYFLLFIVWAFYGALSTKKKSYKQVAAFAAILVFIYGIIIEVLQEQLSPTRRADVNDVLANTIGILLGILIYSLTVKKILKLKNEY